jgi:hypothetical protein
MINVLKDERRQRIRFSRPGGAFFVPAARQHADAIPITATVEY